MYAHLTQLKSTEEALSDARAEAARSGSECDKLRSEVSEREQAMTTSGQAAQEREAALRWVRVTDIEPISTTMT